MTKRDFYTQEEKKIHLEHYRSLPEKQRRYYLAMEYKRLGRGSQRYLAEFFKCSRQTIINGVKEIESPHGLTDHTRQRKPGAGRKKNNNKKDN